MAQSREPLAWISGKYSGVISPFSPLYCKKNELNISLILIINNTKQDDIVINTL